MDVAKGEERQGRRLQQESSLFDSLLNSWVRVNENLMHDTVLLDIDTLGVRCMMKLRILLQCVEACSVASARVSVKFLPAFFPVILYRCPR